MGMIYTKFDFETSLRLYNDGQLGENIFRVGIRNIFSPNAVIIKP